MLSSRPTSSPHSKGVRCHRGAQNADKQMETSNCAAPSSSDFPAPSPIPGPGQRTCQPVPTPAGRVHSRHAQGEIALCPAGAGDLGSRRCPARGGVLGNSALGSRTPSYTRVPRPVPGAGAPAPRRLRRAGAGARVRPARARDRRGRPVGEREGPRDSGSAPAAYLGPGRRSSRAALAPQSGPEQRAARAGGGSCSAPGPAAPAHPRPPPRCASCGQSGSLRSRRRGTRASERGASTKRARSGHGTGTERAGARARGAGERGARVRGGRREREGAGRACGEGKCGKKVEGEVKRAARAQGAGRDGGRRHRESAGRKRASLHFKRANSTNHPKGDEGTSCERTFGDSLELPKCWLLKPLPQATPGPFDYSLQPSQPSYKVGVGFVPIAQMSKLMVGN